jgi:hypothetical protein
MSSDRPPALTHSFQESEKQNLNHQNPTYQLPNQLVMTQSQQNQFPINGKGILHNGQQKIKLNSQHGIHGLGSSSQINNAGGMGQPYNRLTSDQS